MDYPDVDDFYLSDSDYKSLPNIQQMVRKEYMERLNDPDIKDELKGTQVDQKDELPGMNVPQEAVEEGKLPAGLQAYQDKKNGKKADADKDEDKDQDKDEDKEEVDEALNDMAQEHIDALAVLKRMAGLS